LALRKGAAGLALGFVSLTAFYGAYAFMAVRAAMGAITLGDLTLYLSVFGKGRRRSSPPSRRSAACTRTGLFMSNCSPTWTSGREASCQRRMPPLARPARERRRSSFRDVSFRYPGTDKWVLRGVSLRLAAGEKMALVGENGAGKSTLIKLLMRLYDPSEGFDSLRRDRSAGHGRARSARPDSEFSSRTSSAISGPPGRTWGFGWVPALEDRARVERAIEDGGARSVIEQLPQKIDTMLGGWFEEGHELSGGQWQKIALARAFMRDYRGGWSSTSPPPARRGIGARALHPPAAARGGPYRHPHLAPFSTVRRADRIAVLQEGRVEELGTHEELLARNGRYAHLFRLQASGYVS